MPSSVPATKQQIKTLLEAWTWPTFTPDVRWGGPTDMTDYAQGGEMVYFDQVPEYESVADTLGASRLREDFTVRIFIDVVHSGDDEQETDNRAWELHGEVQRMLWQNHNLINGPTPMTVILGDRTARQINVPLPEQWLVRIIVDQEATGYVLTP